MNINDAFPSKYFQATDLDANSPLTLMIERFQIEEVGADEQKERKGVLYFVQQEKGMVLNRTKADVLCNGFGEETDDWVGRTIQARRGTTQFKGKRVACIEIKPVIVNKSAGNAPYNPKVGPNPAMAQTVANVLKRNGPPEPPPIESEDEYGKGTPPWD